MSQYQSKTTAKQFSDFLAVASTEWSVGYPEVLKQIQIGSKVLDYGCGSGEFVTHLSKVAGEVVGADKSEEMLELARTNSLTNATFVSVKSGLPLSWNNSFDFVTANFVFCTQSDTELRNILREIYTALKSGGELVILHSNWDKSNGNEFESFKLNRKENLKDGDTVVVSLKSDQELRVKDIFRPVEKYLELLKSFSFEIISVIEPKAETLNDAGEQPAFYIIRAVKQ